jgi:hypothetical protein
MILEFTAAPGFDFITRFSEKINVPIRDNVLEIPKEMGEGYVRKVAFGDDFKLTIHRYLLKEDLIVKRNPAATSNNVRTIFFYNNKEDFEVKYNNEKTYHSPQKMILPFSCLPMICAQKFVFLLAATFNT